MKYNGMKLKEFTSDKPLVFDPPKLMLCWSGHVDEAFPHHVFAFVPNREEGFAAVICKSSYWQHCAEIPEISKEPKPRRATNRELAMWLAKGNGEWKNAIDGYPCRRTDLGYCEDTNPAPFVLVRKWDDTEWHEPTANYMGLED